MAPDSGKKSRTEGTRLQAASQEPATGGANRLLAQLRKVRNAVVQGRSAFADGQVTVQISINRQLVMVDVCGAHSTDIILTGVMCAHSWRSGLHARLLVKPRDHILLVEWPEVW